MLGHVVLFGDNGVGVTHQATALLTPSTYSPCPVRLIPLAARGLAAVLAQAGRRAPVASWPPCSERSTGAASMRR
jgi:hypothetical protein